MICKEEKGRGGNGATNGGGLSGNSDFSFTWGVVTWVCSFGTLGTL